MSSLDPVTSTAHSCVFLIFNSTRVERAKLPFAEEKHEVVQSQQCPGPHLRNHV
ncbi:hypothetical protein ACRRTK_022784 [Alexandromys fortis]